MRACVRANERTNENVVRSPGGRLLSTTAPIYRQGGWNDDDDYDDDNGPWFSFDMTAIWGKRGTWSGAAGNESVARFPGMEME